MDTKELSKVGRQIGLNLGDRICITLKTGDSFLGEFSDYVSAADNEPEPEMIVLYLNEKYDNKFISLDDIISIEKIESEQMFD